MTKEDSSFERALEQLVALDQETAAHELEAAGERFDAFQKQTVEAQIAALDPHTLRTQVACLRAPSEKTAIPCKPILNVEQAPSTANCDAGPIAAGKVACLVVAGGQGSRLNFDGPKGLFPVSPSGKTLFQLLAERVAAASAWAGRPLSIAVMTSPINHEETVAYFEENNHFGLDPQQLDFFTQEMLPFLDEDGHLFCDVMGHIATGPTGNGVALQNLVASGIWDKWQQQGIKQVTFVQVDNVLMDPFDLRLVEHHIASGHDVTLKSVERTDPEEKVGVIVREEGKAAVLEYSEISDEDRLAMTPSGSLLHRCANISEFCFSMDFIGAVKTVETPWHTAFKAIGRVDSGGSRDEEFHGWKFEKFIFDVLQSAKHVGVLLYPRHECFAAVKSQDSLPAVQLALSEYHRSLHITATGKPVTDEAFELDPALYYQRR